MQMEGKAPGAICMDCALHDQAAMRQVAEGVPAGYFCKHWRPEHWEAEGYQRDWGDAAVMNWPTMEILRREVRTEQGTEVRFVILAPHALRRPLMIEATAGPETRLTAWGAY
jgi:hypothetical protein